MTGTEIYWILKLDVISATAQLITGLMAIALVILIVLFCIYFIDGEEVEKKHCGYESEGEYKERLNAFYANRKKYLRYLVIATPIVFVLLVAAILIPNTKQAIAMKVGPKILNSDAFKEAEKTPEKVFKVVNDKLDEYIKEQK